MMMMFLNFMLPLWKDKGRCGCRGGCHWGRDEEVLRRCCFVIISISHAMVIEGAIDGDATSPRLHRIAETMPYRCIGCTG